MGILRSTVDHSGNDHNGVTLGVPVIIDGLFCWDTGTYPTGEIDAAGVVTVDQTDILEKPVEALPVALTYTVKTAKTRATTLGFDLARNAEARDTHLAEAVLE